VIASLLLEFLNFLGGPGLLRIIRGETGSYFV